jgi:hypothetical protein
MLSGLTCGLAILVGDRGGAFLIVAGRHLHFTISPSHQVPNRNLQQVKRRPDLVIEHVRPEICGAQVRHENERGRDEQQRDGE